MDNLFYLMRFHRYKGWRTSKDILSDFGKVSDNFINKLYSSMKMIWPCLITVLKYIIGHMIFTIFIILFGSHMVHIIWSMSHAAWRLVEARLMQRISILACVLFVFLFFYRMEFLKHLRLLADRSLAIDISSLQHAAMSC